MGIPQLSKYIIIFLFAVLVVLSVMLGIYSAENKHLSKDNTRLKEKVLLQDVAIKEIDVNIELLKNQLQEAESICNDRLKARNDLLVFLKNEPFKDTDNRVFYPACAISDSSLFAREIGSPRKNHSPSLNEILHTGSETGAEGSTAPVNNWVGNSEAVPHPNRPLLQGQVPQKCDSATLGYNKNKYKVVSDEKSVVAVDYINSYWLQFTQSSNSKK